MTQNTVCALDLKTLAGIFGGTYSTSDDPTAVGELYILSVQTEKAIRSGNKTAAQGYLDKMYWKLLASEDRLTSETYTKFMRKHTDYILEIQKM